MMDRMEEYRTMLAELETVPSRTEGCVARAAGAGPPEP